MDRNVLNEPAGHLLADGVRSIGLPPDGCTQVPTPRNQPSLGSLLELMVNMLQKAFLNLESIGNSALRVGRKHWKAVLMTSLSLLIFLTAGVYAKPIKSNGTLSTSQISKGNCCGTLAQRVSFLTEGNTNAANLVVFSRSVIFKPNQAYVYISHVLELNSLSISFESNNSVAGLAWSPPRWTSETLPGTPRLSMSDDLKSGTLYFEKMTRGSNQGIILEFPGLSQISLTFRFGLDSSWLLGTHSYIGEVTLSVELGPPVAAPVSG